jgi:hypothetical protein
MGPSDVTRQANHLRDAAERYLRLASGTDQVTHDALVMYASELLDRAQKLRGRSGPMRANIRFPTLAPSPSAKGRCLPASSKTELEEKGSYAGVGVPASKADRLTRLGLRNDSRGGSDVTVEVDGNVTQARVMDRREFVSRHAEPARPRPLPHGVRPILMS